MSPPFCPLSGKRMPLFRFCFLFLSQTVNLNIFYLREKKNSWCDRMCMHHYNGTFFLEKFALDFAIFRIAEEYISNGEIPGRGTTLLGSFQHCLPIGSFSASLRPQGTSSFPPTPRSGAHWAHHSTTHCAGVLSQRGSGLMHLQCSLHSPRQGSEEQHGCFEEETPIFVVLSPSQKRETVVEIPGSRGDRRMRDRGEVLAPVQESQNVGP